MTRVMVDMSATIIHHGHVRLIKEAMKYGEVVVGLTTDDQILKCKGYQPELSFENRKEILESIEGVMEVVPTPWLITEELLDQHKVDYLLHGHDNSNPISKNRLIVLPRTNGISSTEIRERAFQSICSLNNKKLFLTPGPAAISFESVRNIKPVFGRGDSDYLKIHSDVTDWLKTISGQDEIVAAQGSATFAIELALHTFVKGKVLLVVTGYYSDRIEKLLPKSVELQTCSYAEIDSISGDFDWVLCAYTETSHAFKLDLEKIKRKSDELGASLFVDSTGSIGLEEHHNLCDVTAFSSCKGLFGLTGACFIAHKKGLTRNSGDEFYFNIETHAKKLVTGPYHIMTSLYGVMRSHDVLKKRVQKSKEVVMDSCSGFISSEMNQPLLCTYLEGKVVPNNEDVILYCPRSNLPGSIICHLGEVQRDEVMLMDRIKVEGL